MGPGRQSSTAHFSERPVMRSFSRFLWQGVVLVLSLCSFGTSSPLRADDDPPDDEVVVEKQANQVVLENAEDSLFGARNPTAVPATRIHLEEILKRKLNAARARWQLSDGQIAKLEFVGSNAITKLFEQIDQHAKRLKAARQGINDRYDDNPLNRETSEIRSKIRSGPFGDDSLFTKVLRQLLTAEQVAEYDQRLAKVTNPPRISRENAGDLARGSRIGFNAFRMSWNRDGSRLALLDFQKKVEIFSFPEANLLRTLEENNGPQDFEFGPNDDLVAIARDQKGTLIANLTTGQEIRALPGGSPLAFSPDGRSVVVGGYGRSVTLWAIPGGRMIRKFSLEGHEGGLTPVFSPDGTMLAVGNRNSTTHIFEMATGQVLHVLPHNMSHQLRFHPKGDLLAVVYVDGSLILWDTKTGELRRQVKAFANELYTVDWSPDGTLLATAGYHTPVTLWNPDNLSIVNELESPEWIFDVKFSPDGTRLLTAGYGLVRAAEKFVDIWAVP